MFLKFKHWIENHFSTVLLSSLVIGLFLPGADQLPGSILMVIVGFMIYFSCARITMQELREITPSKAVAFYAARFLVFPLILYGVAAFLFPGYKDAILLLALAPAGATAGALAGIFGGNATAALGYTVVSSLLAPFVISAAFALVGGASGSEIDIGGLFYTLCAVLFLPAALYFGGARNIAPLKEWSRANARFYSVLLLGLLGVVVAGLSRETIFTNPFLVAEMAPLIAGLFFIFYAFGWLFPYGKKTATRIAHTISSGAMNNGLVLGISAVYFSPEITLFLVLTEIPWVLSLPLFKFFLQKTKIPAAQPQ